MDGILDLHSGIFGFNALWFLVVLLGHWSLAVNYDVVLLPIDLWFRA